MKITVMGALVVIGGVLLLALALYAVGQDSSQAGKNNDQSTDPT